MSRIIHGPSNEVRAMRPVTKPREPGVFRPPAFHTFTIEGAQSEEEVAAQMATAKAQGYREAEQRLVQPLRAGLENVERILDELSKFRRELFKDAEADVLSMVQTIAQRVVMKELELKPELMKGVVEKAISHLEKQRHLVLRINPADFETYQRAKPDFLEKFKGLEDLGVEVDAQIPRGSVILKSKVIELDVNLASMVDHLMTQIKASKIDVSKTNDEGDLM